jgi:hypothetical protein
VWLAPAGALAYCIAQFWPLLVDVGRFAPLLLMVAGVIAALVAGVLRLATRGRVHVALLVMLGLQASTPVEVGWDDGCNGHSGEIAMIAVPYVKLAEPEMSYAPYSDAQTLMACF